MNRSTTDRGAKAFSLMEMFVIVGVMVLLFTIIVPSFIKAKKQAQRINCFNTLRAGGFSFRLWAEDNYGKFPMQVAITNGGTKEFIASEDTFRHFQIMSNELSTPKIVVCPSDSRPAATNFTTAFSNANVSYFVGVDAVETNVQMLLIGDRNVVNGTTPVKGMLELTTNNPARWTGAIHNRAGNIALADGSVRQVDIPGLQKLVENSGVATNRLSLP